MNNESLQEVRDIVCPIADKISSLAQMVATATKVSTPQSQVDIYAVGFLNEMIVQEAQKIEEAFYEFLEPCQTSDSEGDAEP